MRQLILYFSKKAKINIWPATEISGKTILVNKLKMKAE
jgi:hypothetical protein